MKEEWVGVGNNSLVLYKKQWRWLIFFIHSFNSLFLFSFCNQKTKRKKKKKKNTKLFLFHGYLLTRKPPPPQATQRSITTWSFPSFFDLAFGIFFFLFRLGLIFLLFIYLFIFLGGVNRALQNPSGWLLGWFGRWEQCLWMGRHDYWSSRYSLVCLYLFFFFFFFF